MAHGMPKATLPRTALDLHAGEMRSRRCEGILVSTVQVLGGSRAQRIQVRGGGAARILFRYRAIMKECTVVRTCCFGMVVILRFHLRDSEMQSVGPICLQLYTVFEKRQPSRVQR